ncbi:MAG: hypothetical protein COW65_16105 [Cytophagales bacterium CG18_big_fil_WC_8_21_14_2_50_42_9]|nr:MAG: hypothetical protein COW65_16105 [Cytophagales bacterium CG18_big_fil_WC_8_21_14_2_50_42_9]
MKPNRDISLQTAQHTADSRIWQELNQRWRQLPYQEITTDYSHFLQSNPVVEKMLDSSPCITWIIDIRTMQYVYMSRNVKEKLGYAVQQFTDNGVAFFNDIVHPEDQHKIWRLVKIVWDYLLHLPAAERPFYKFSCDYRLVKPDGTCIRFLEQNSVLQLDSQGNITHLLGVGSDITHWKKNDNILATVISTKDGTSFTCTPEDTNLKTQTMLSKREREVVRLVAAGYNSRHIADELFISVHTVNTHRQHIIEKTNVKNTSGMVQYAFSHGLI